MTIGAVRLVFVIQTDAEGAALEDMIAFIAMAVGADHALAPHVHIQVASGVDERVVEITMLDCIAAATTEMAGAAVEAGGVAHVFGNVHQIH